MSFFAYANTGYGGKYKSLIDIPKNTDLDKVELRLTAHP